ncbi:alaserpin-like isoform X1 [Spodoptera litura]|uniref:Alaserpin-like isoform X1 n=1 Tax=Spodoptera litura TaxID=69820 RepID=A0A9J7DV26_SPOLT|nr:alaserpin-like isoform X1 [Spodoptera litura]
MKLFICVLALAATAMSDSNLDILKAGSDQFTAKMFQEVVKAKPNENIVMSAFSLLSPLAQLGLASEGESHDEVLRAIGLPNDNVTKEVFTEVNRQLRSVKGIELNLASRVYVRQGEELNPQFAAVSRDVFNSDARNIDFSKNVEAAKEINTWVEDQTNHRIKDLVAADSLDALTAAVLVNAMYFKGKWKIPFKPEQTEDRDFHVSKDEIVKKPTMHVVDDFKYGESKELDAKLLEMSYSGDESSLLIVLPNEIDGINNLVKKLENPELLSKAMENMYTNEVIVDLPKFKIETTTDLADILYKMNIKKLFTRGEARLNYLIKDAKDLYVSNALQKAFIEVNEEGAEAAVANDFSLDVRAAFRSTYDFRADHPFVFAILCNSKELYRNLNTFTGVLVR